MTGPFPRKAAILRNSADIGNNPSSAARFVKGIFAHCPEALIANSRSQPMLVTYGDLSLPISVEDGQFGSTYVANPHSAYVLYARDEIDIVGLKGAARLGAKASLSVLDRGLKALRFNRTVHLDNWMLSTNLHGRWDGTGLPAIRRALAETFPDHFIVMRCVDPWSCPQLTNSLQSDGWSLLPSRQIWVTDDLEADWKPRSHTKSDWRAMRKSGLVIEDLDEMSKKDAARIVELYAQLYLQRYSALNPAYTPAFVQLAFECGMLRWRVARDSRGTIMASAGMRIAGDLVTVPMLGYDTTRPQSEALYRIASLLSSQWAMERGFRHHGSAGAGVFKSNRGARAKIEYMAVHAGHLGRARRSGMKAFAELLEHTMVPALKTQGW